MSGAFGTIRGFLFKSPELKTAKSGNQYSTATLKVKDGNETKFWRIMGFKDATKALMQFSEGDSLQCEGGIKCEAYTKKDGSTAIGLTLMANSIEAYSPQASQRQ